jgi:hypothetical protein
METRKKYVINITNAETWKQLNSSKCTIQTNIKRKIRKIKEDNIGKIPINTEKNQDIKKVDKVHKYDLHK